MVVVVRGGGGGGRRGGGAVGFGGSCFLYARNMQFRIGGKPGNCMIYVTNKNRDTGRARFSTVKKIILMNHIKYKIDSLIINF